MRAAKHRSVRCIRTESGKKVCSAVASRCKTNASSCDAAKIFCSDPNSTSASNLNTAGDWVIGNKERLQFSLSDWPSGTESLSMTIKPHTGGPTYKLSTAKFLKAGFIAPDIVLNSSREAD